MFQVKHGAAGWRAFFKKWGALVVLCALPLAFPCLSQAQTPMADSDGNGLIEIDSLLMLHNMRHNLAGTSYKASAGSAGNSSGCPTTGGCVGYELTQNLDFDADKDGSTWSGSADEGYILDPEDSQADYFPVQGGAGGWLPIGNETNPFVAVFDGNSYTISGLAIRRDQTYVGLFGRTGGAVIRNLGLIDNLADYTGSGSNTISIDGEDDDGWGGLVGGLVGLQENGSITASYATGAAAGGDGNEDVVGGLVGWQFGGSITASYATGAADGGDGNDDFVGGLVGLQENGSITASDAAVDVDGGNGDEDYVGGLVGLQFSGSITASYATGAADGGDGDEDFVGGLVGFQEESSSITASYAMGAADGGDGFFDHVGGLVGRQYLGSIKASYAMGAADGGDDGGDYVGGLVGYQEVGSTITASYATGDVDDGGGGGGGGSVGGLVGLQYGGSITASYGFGAVKGVEAGEPGVEGSAGSPKPDGVRTAAQLTAANAGAAWDSADSNTLGAWNFVNDFNPMLNYADYDGGGAVFDCDQFPANACGTLLPGQQRDGGGIGPDPGTGPGPDPGLGPSPMADSDGNGLIEIDSLLMLHNMRHNLEGTSYKTSTASVGNSLGCPSNTGCIGYELTRNLDFDADKDGSWSGSADEGYTLDQEDSRADYFLVENGAGGWLPIGGETNPFVAVFDGNSHTISGLAIRRDQTYVGLFGRTEGAVIRNLGLIGNLADYTGSSDNPIYIGGLVGSMSGGAITASYATGPAAYGGDGMEYGYEDSVGGLVGYQFGGSITASYATGDVYGGDGGEDFVGGLVGLCGGGSVITASYATGDAYGGDGHYDSVGGLVGYQDVGSTITASYATGDADGGYGDSDNVGGLVGGQEESSITASYATGAAAGGAGSDDVGGLVGRQSDSSITASYATGDAAGGDGHFDSVGGLVGYQEVGSITASYATGAADGGDGDGDFVGGLVGLQENGSITASYGFGESLGEESRVPDGSPKPDGVSTAAELTAGNAGKAWDDASSNTLDVWDFGTEEQIPALNYADYDGGGDVFDCDQFPANACGALLPGQADASASGPSAAAHGETVALVGSLRFGRVTIEDWRWRQLAGPRVVLSGDGEARETSFTAPATKETLVFELTATDSEGRQYTDRFSLAGTLEVDLDGNGLIEIDSLLMLHNMRHNLAGTSYKASADSSGNDEGCPTEDGCTGYELTRNLDFDADKDGSTWSGDADDGYTLDSGDRNADYFPVQGGAGGWLPIGGETNPFVAVFDGNSHTISGLAIRRDQTYVGLFGRTEGAVIRSLGLIDNLADYTGSGSNTIFIGGEEGVGLGGFVGGLVGFQANGSITASYVTGDAAGGGGDVDFVGGLVGVQYGSSITASYATGAAYGGDGDYDRVGGLVGAGVVDSSITASDAAGAVDGGDGEGDAVGGLVGYQESSSITASYATGDANGGDGDGDSVGGLVGVEEESSSITASYATGAADGGDGDDDSVGGLVGFQYGSLITASYATGDADGGAGNYGTVGGLVGYQFSGSITASYAMGAADGGGGDGDYVGGLVGQQREGGSITSITASYGFGEVKGVEASEPGSEPGVEGSAGSTKPQGVSTAAELTAANAGDAWDSADSNTLGAWNFGTDAQIPVLNYADYDGDGAVFDCDQFPANACGTLLRRTLLLRPSQRDGVGSDNGGEGPDNGGNGPDTDNGGVSSDNGGGSLGLWALAALAPPLLLGLRRRRRRLIRDAAVAGQKLAMKKDRPLAAGPSKFV